MQQPPPWRLRDLLVISVVLVYSFGFAAATASTSRGQVDKDQIVWLGEFFCHRLLLKQRLVPSVRQVARVKLSPTILRREDRATLPHHLVSGLKFTR